MSSKKKTKITYCSDTLVRTLNTLLCLNPEDRSVNTSCMYNNSCFIRHLWEERGYRISPLSTHQSVMLNVYFSVSSTLMDRPNPGIAYLEQWLTMGWMVWGSILMRTRYSSPIQTSPEASPASYTLGTGSFLGVKWLGHGVDHPPPTIAECKKE
jgi:hypothetical protein